MDDANELLSQMHRDYFVSKFSETSSNQQYSRKSQKVETIKSGDDLKRSAVLVPLCRIGNQVGILFTKRSGALRAHAGQVSFPGGRCDGGETPIETALRETSEEIGVNPDDVDVWTVMPSVPGRQKTDLVTPVVAEIKVAADGLHLNRAEVDSVFIKKLSDLHNEDTCRHTQFRGFKGSHVSGGYTLPLYTTEPYHIWGLTAIITYQFLSVFLKRRPSVFRHKLNYQSPIKLGNSIDRKLFGADAGDSSAR